MGDKCVLDPERWQETSESRIKKKKKKNFLEPELELAF